MIGRWDSSSTRREDSPADRRRNVLPTGEEMFSIRLDFDSPRNVTSRWPEEEISDPLTNILFFSFFQRSTVHQRRLEGKKVKQQSRTNFNENDLDERRRERDERHGKINAFSQTNLKRSVPVGISIRERNDERQFSLGRVERARNSSH